MAKELACEVCTCVMLRLDLLVLSCVASFQDSKIFYSAVELEPFEGEGNSNFEVCCLIFH